MCCDCHLFLLHVFALCHCGGAQGSLPPGTLPAALSAILEAVAESPKAPGLTSAPPEATRSLSWHQNPPSQPSPPATGEKKPREEGYSPPRASSVTSLSEQVPEPTSYVFGRDLAFCWTWHHCRIGTPGSSKSAPFASSPLTDAALHPLTPGTTFPPAPAALTSSHLSPVL